MIDTPSTPDVPRHTSDDVRAVLRSQNRKVALLAVPLLILGGLTVRYSVQSSASSSDSFNATSSQLANNARSACITERRSAQSDAIGRATIAGLRAQIAAFIADDDAEALRQVGLVEQAAEDFTAASESLLPETVDEEPPLGCGPPILSLEDLPDSDPTSSTIEEG